MLLIHVDPTQHMDRWYYVIAQPTLLDEWVVVCVWGNRRNSYQRCRCLLVQNKDAAQELAARIVRQKLRKGYEPFN